MKSEESSILFQKRVINLFNTQDFGALVDFGAFGDFVALVDFGAFTSVDVRRNLTHFVEASTGNFVTLPSTKKIHD